MESKPHHGASHLLTIRRVLNRQSSGISDDHVEAVVAAILFEKPDLEPEILLVQRAERAGDPWSGHIGLPGGRIKATDASPKDAVAREVLEEVGFDVLQSGDLLGSLPASYPWNRPELKVRPFVFGLDSKPKVVVGSEIVSAFWVRLRDLPGLLTQSEVQTRLGPRTVESFLVNGHIVWGFTFRVLNELLSLESSSGESGG